MVVTEKARLKHRTRRIAPAWLMLLQALICTFLSIATAQEAWELRVCADPDNAPVSTQALDGYENLIAEIVAESLGARLSYVWTRVDDYAVRTLLRAGECDVMMSVAEGAMGLLNTVSYHRIPLVFLFRTEAGYSIDSLYDPQLASLRIAAMPNTLVHSTLLDLGLGQSFLGIRPSASGQGPERIRPLVEAVLTGQVDVAIVPGAHASLHVERSAGALSYLPVEPELVPPMSPMFQMATMGVRPYDEALRDALNEAIALRWDDIAAVFDQAGVPTLPSVPVSLGLRAAAPFRVGVIAPFPTGNPSITDVVGRAAYYGARVADDLVGRPTADRALPFDLEVVYASAPTAETAARAMTRLVRTHGVDAVVGGYDDASAELLAAAARELGLLFVNVGANADALRDPGCYPTTFHVAPSVSMYTGALFDGAAGPVPARWLLVSQEDSPAQSAWVRSVRQAAARSGSDVVEMVVPAGPAAFRPALQRLRSEPFDAVLATAVATDYEMLLAQVEQEGIDVPVLGVPELVTQSREFYFRLAQVAPRLSGMPRLAVWDPSLNSAEAVEILGRFMGRAGEPMDSAAWSTYVGISLAAEAAAGAGATDMAALVAQLVQETASFNVLKGRPVRFDVSSHQLLHPLYLVRIDAGTPWSTRAFERLSMASVVAELATPLTPVGSTTVGPGGHDQRPECP